MLEPAAASRAAAAARTSLRTAPIASQAKAD